MSHQKLLWWTGIGGMVAALLVGAGEFLLHYTPAILTHGADFDFFAFVAPGALQRGHWLAIVGLPLYFVGYYHLYQMLRGGGEQLARVFLLLGVVAFMVGGIWLSSRAMVGSIVQTQTQMDVRVYEQLLSQYHVLYELLVWVLRSLIAMLSVVWVRLVWTDKTSYPRWMVVCNPLLLLLVVFGLYAVVPVIGQFLAPIAMNVVHMIVFGLSLYLLMYDENTC